MKETECEQRQVKMVAGEGYAAEEQAGQTIWFLPGGQVLRPAVGTFNLDLQQGKEGGANNDSDDEKKELHGQQWFDFTGKDIKGILTERGKAGPSDHLPPILPDHRTILTINE